MVADENGEVLAGRDARLGPNPFRVSGKIAGTAERFRYPMSMVEAGRIGLAWNEAHFVAYVMDPTGSLREYLGNNSARGSASFRLRSTEDAANLYAHPVPPSYAVMETTVAE